MYYIQINFCQIETIRQVRWIKCLMKLNTLRCDVFFAQQTRRSPPSGNLSQHISLADLDCSRDFVRCFPYVFQSNSQGTLDMCFPSIDLQCFKVCYFQMAGENSVETRMRKEDHFFWSSFGFGMIFPQQNAVMIHSKTIALEVLRGGLASVFVGHGNG